MTAAVTPEIQAPPETRSAIQQRNIDVAERHYAKTGTFFDLPNFSEADITQSFVRARRDQLAYLDCGRWAVYQDGLWKKEHREGLIANRRAIEYMATVLLPQVDVLVTNPAARAATRNKLASVKLAGTIASAARGWLGRRSDEFDQDEYLLGAPGGKVIDLRTCELRDAQPEDMLMKSVACRPDHSECPKWLKFMAEITNADKALEHYLHKMMGSWLTGSTKDHSLTFWYGGAGNGKGTAIGVLSHILKDYATPISIECLLSKKNDGGDMQAIGQMCGARLVVAQEIDPHRRFNAGLLKTISGGDELCGRKLYEDPVTFRPTHKLLVASNYKPRVDVDGGIRRRLHIVPFVRNFEAVKNENLKEELIGEAPAILTWLMRGCILWQKEGLAKPGAVLAANEDFFEEQDDFKAWLEQKCVVDPRGWTPTAKLYASWRAHCEATGTFKGKQSDLVENLTREGFTKKKSKDQTQRGISGLALKNNGPTEVV